MESREFVDFYKFLGIESSSKVEQIEEACIQQGEKYRAGKNQNDLVAAMNFARTEKAYETLMNPEKKAEYDRVYQDYTLNSSTEFHSAPPCCQGREAGISNITLNRVALRQSTTCPARFTLNRSLTIAGRVT